MSTRPGNECKYLVERQAFIPRVKSSMPDLAIRPVGSDMLMDVE